MTKYVLLLGLGLAFIASAIALQQPGARAQATACGTPHDSLNAEEQQFLGLVQGWRDANMPGQAQLQVSGALNAAAAWFAEWQVNNGTPGGHFDSMGRDWRQRALQCGYTTQTSGGIYYALQASGEATYAVGVSGGAQVGPAEAVAGMQYTGSGLYMNVPPGPQYPPVKCVGAAVYRNETGTEVAWIMVIAQHPAALPCPESTAASVPTATATTATSTASPTMTATPTRTPSPTPTPPPPPVVLPAIARD